MTYDDLGFDREAFGGLTYFGLQPFGGIEILTVLKMRIFYHTEMSGALCIG
jgi:hypothetical protein